MEVLLEGSGAASGGLDGRFIFDSEREGGASDQPLSLSESSSAVGGTIMGGGRVGSGGFDTNGSREDMDDDFSMEEMMLNQNRKVSYLEN